MGTYIFTGNGRGIILVHDTETCTVFSIFLNISRDRASNTAVQSIEFARRGSSFFLNTADQVIRVYDSAEVLACG